MADIDIFNIEPNKISRDLKGKFVLIYGEAKSGKTSFSSLFPKPLLCAFERGYNALPGVKVVDINRWTDFKKVCSQLKKPEAHDIYETIVIDTVGIATDMCKATNTRYIYSIPLSFVFNHSIELRPTYI